MSRFGGNRDVPDFDERTEGRSVGGVIVDGDQDAALAAIVGDDAAGGGGW